MKLYRMIIGIVFMGIAVAVFPTQPAFALGWSLLAICNWMYGVGTEIVDAIKAGKP